MSILYVGDLHGQLPAVIAIDAFALEMGVDAVFQVGDFGLGWPGDDPLAPWFTASAGSALRVTSTSPDPGPPSLG